VVSGFFDKRDTQKVPIWNLAFFERILFDAIKKDDGRVCHKIVSIFYNNKNGRIPVVTASIIAPTPFQRIEVSRSYPKRKVLTSSD